MKERPILFSGPMVKAILEGRKTQTRRVVKHRQVLEWLSDTTITPASATEWCQFQPGDHAWVRETWADLRGKGFDAQVAYGVDTRPGSDGDDARKSFGVKWRPSIHMPRWANRITLEITGVRVQRLQEISDDAVLDEGFERKSFCDCEACSRGNLYCTADKGATLRDFVDLWDSIAKPGQDWAANPWVWVIEFKRVGEK